MILQYENAIFHKKYKPYKRFVTDLKNYIRLEFIADIVQSANSMYEVNISDYICLEFQSMKNNK